MWRKRGAGRLKVWKTEQFGSIGNTLDRYRVPVDSLARQNAYGSLQSWIRIFSIRRRNVKQFLEVCPRRSFTSQQIGEPRHLAEREFVWENLRKWRPPSMPIVAKPSGLRPIRGRPIRGRDFGDRDANEVALA